MKRAERQAWQKLRARQVQIARKICDRQHERAWRQYIRRRDADPDADIDCPPFSEKTIAQQHSYCDDVLRDCVVILAAFDFHDWGAQANPR